MEQRSHIKILFTAPIRTQAFSFICKTSCNVSVELSYPAHFIHKNPCKKTLKKYAFFVDRQIKVMYKSVSSSGSNSAVECNLAKVEVAGSNPVSRSRQKKIAYTAASPSGKAEACKAFISSSNLEAASIYAGVTQR